MARLGGCPRSCGGCVLRGGGTDLHFWLGSPAQLPAAPQATLLPEPHGELSVIGKVGNVMCL